MFGFNFVDVVIVFLLGGAVVGGRRLGLSNQILVVGGFFVALFGFGWLFPHLLPIQDRTAKTLLNANLVLFGSFYVAIRGYDLSQRLHWDARMAKKLLRWRLQTLDGYLGIVCAVVASLILIWLVATALGRLPFAGLSNSVNDAQIVQLLSRALPPVPSVFAEFDRQVNPNTQPAMTIQLKPQAAFNYSVPDFQTASLRASASVVRITSFGCNGVVSGSGFVAAPDLIITNAHVVAGVQRPIIKYQGKSYAAVPVLFNAGLDLAILRIDDFPAPTLQLATSDVPSDTTVATLGYPGGNYQVSAGIIRDNLTVFGPNIYQVGNIGRDVYEVQTAVGEGSSGGPIVLANGQVAGIIFSRSTDAPEDGFALASSHLIASLGKARNSSQRVSTSACLAE